MKSLKNSKNSKKNKLHSKKTKKTKKVNKVNKVKKGGNPLTQALKETRAAAIRRRVASGMPARP